MIDNNLISNAPRIPKKLRTFAPLNIKCIVDKFQAKQNLSINRVQQTTKNKQWILILEVFLIS